MADILASEKSISDLIHLAELCIEVLRQNEEHHAEVRFSFWSSYEVLKF